MPEITPARGTATLLGLAYGDAIGDPLEFVKFPELRQRYGVAGPPIPARLRITDDTQMSLAVWDALSDTALDGPVTAASSRPALIRRFLAWRVDPDNNRAPGATCMSALDRLSRYRRPLRSWTSATVARSSGCGAVMRAPWIGVHPRVADDQVEPIARAQAALTHGHPEATAAAAATAHLVRELATERIRAHQLPDALLAWARVEWRRGYDADALDNLYKRCGRMSAQEYTQRGAWAVANAAFDARSLVECIDLEPPLTFDPCAVAGEGWTSAECLAVAVGLVAGCAIGEYAAEDVLRAAAMTGGDSDSIAAVTGALVGAAGWIVPTALFGRLEPRYQRELALAAGAFGLSPLAAKRCVVPA